MWQRGVSLFLEAGKVLSANEGRLLNNRIELFSFIMADDFQFVVKWSGKEYAVVVKAHAASVLCLKKAIQDETGVKVGRQKLLNLKFKGWIFQRFFIGQLFAFLPLCYLVSVPFSPFNSWAVDKLLPV